jgi:cysteinyl-tRNA synthetase
MEGFETGTRAPAEGSRVPLRVHNTMARRKEDFAPAVPGQILMYLCGVTVYDLAHIGHARSAIAFDVIRRYLRFKGFHVQFVKNYTDVDDRIIRRANEQGVSAREISERYIAEDRTDMASLGVLPPDAAPKATEHIPQMIALIGRLMDKGLAYTVDGDVYFEVQRFPAYGRLSGKNLDELLAGARVEVDERKRDPRDFALWKAAKPGEPSWPSPWGAGRPGWHIECSAMAMQHLGESIDIHGGGEDLIFPHHECEIAQSEGASGKPLSRYWLHNAFVNMGAEKMSKSLGNTLTVREMVRRHDPEAIRLYLLGTHYRHPLEFGDERIGEAARALGRLRSLKEEADRIAAKGAPAPGPDRALLDDVAALRARFEAAMDDDFNTPQALGVLFDLARVLYAARDQIVQGSAGAGAFLLGVGELVTLSATLGLLEGPGREQAAIAPELMARIESLVSQRREARGRRDFPEADRLRRELQGMGVTLEDTGGETVWKLAP